ncbi:MAG: hypothetical protein KDJ24_01005 [Gammaproteobacteria bacterium]|nr:hypothetical protein [Gammaproteobacteria bacterium]
MNTPIHLLCALLFALLPLTAAAVDQTICPRYPVETVDSGLGEDFEDYYALNDTLWPYWKARGAAYQVLDPDSLQVIQQGYGNDDNGCFVLAEEDIPASNEITLLLYLESRLLDHIRVRTRVGDFAECNDNPFANHAGEPTYCQPLACMALMSNLTGAEKKYVDYTCNTPEVTLQALANFPSYWWHHFDPAALTYDFVTTVRHRNGCAADAASCSNAGFADSDDIEIIVNIDDETEDKYRQKFLVGHEVGHAAEEAYQKATFGTENYLYGGYNLIGGGPQCGSAGEQHALTSLEYTSDGIMEGFAHFLSADAYNDHHSPNGRFTYYKDDLGFPRDIALEGESAFDAAEPFRSNRYAERVCDPVPQNAGTELDWLRFFWDLHTAAAAPDMQHETLLKLRVDAAFQGTLWHAQNGYELLEDNVCSGAPEVQALQADFLDFAGSDDTLGGNGVEPTGAGPACN